MDVPPALGELLVRHGADLEALVARHAGGLVRQETIEDLLQGARLRALESESGFTWHGYAAFQVWLARVARSYLDDRRAYWSAARRAAGHLLRITEAAPSEGGVGLVVPSPRTGPRTFAERRDELALAAQAVGALLPRDQEILRLEREGATLPELAAHLGLAHEAAGRARLRALERFQRTYELLARGGG